MTRSAVPTRFIGYINGKPVTSSGPIWGDVFVALKASADVTTLYPVGLASRHGGVGAYIDGVTSDTYEIRRMT
jgi:hypothetical protein